MKALAVNHRLEPIADHLQRFRFRPSLGHGIKQRNLGQPESSVTREFPFESHFRSLPARFRIACASFSLISRWWGTASLFSPSVHRSCLPPLRKKYQPHSVSRFSRSRRFTDQSVHQYVYALFQGIRPGSRGPCVFRITRLETSAFSSRKTLPFPPPRLSSRTPATGSRFPARSARRDRCARSQPARA